MRALELTILFVGAMLLSLFVMDESARFIKGIELPAFVRGASVPHYESGRLLFVPDIMLGRSVEILMEEKGNYYPFLEFQNIFKPASTIVGNFEANVPETHVRTESLGMRFSVPESYLSILRNAGFSVLSLANNHTLDHGEAGYKHTREVCVRVGLICVGHPVRLDQSSYTKLQIGDTPVTVLMIHTLFEKPSTTSLALLIDEMETQSDVQIAFVHWGDEYQTIHNGEQKELATFLIDEGVDTVIGHHPHVRQDMTFYQGKPIFYSLGNFIFDQFFSPAVQKGYAIEMEVNKRNITYIVHPYELQTVRSQPRPEEGEARKASLEGLLGSHFSDRDVLQTGRFTVSRE